MSEVDLRKQVKDLLQGANNHVIYDVLADVLAETFIEVADLNNIDVEERIYEQASGFGQMLGDAITRELQARVSGTQAEEDKQESDQS